MRPQQQQDNRPRIKADLESVSILPGRWRNFRGVATDYNNEGNRNFNVVLDAETAARMRMDGWRVKEKAPWAPEGELPDDGAEPDYYINVKVGYKWSPPQIYLITNVKTPIGESLVGDLDDLEILNADITLSGKWNDMAGGGYTAYLREGYFVIMQTNLARKWDNVPMAGAQEAVGRDTQEQD